MKESVQNLIRRSRQTLLGLLFAGVLGVSGFAGVLGGASASAQACASTNIVRCGIPGGSTSAQIASFKALYASGADSGHHDLKAIFRWAGADDNMVAHVSTTNTKMGTLYRNGDIKINGAVVGTDAVVAARFTKGNGFTQISKGVWARKTTTSFDQASAPVLVHLTTGGSANFAVMTNCGNAVKFTPMAHPAQPSAPKPTPPKHTTTTTTTSSQPPSTSNNEFACDILSPNITEDDATNSFEATATADGTVIDRYVFDFGDGTRTVVKSHAREVNVSHRYARDDALRTVVVVVFDTQGHKATGPGCVLVVRAPAPLEAEDTNTECKPGIPVGSAECNDQTAVLGATTTTPDNTTPSPTTDTSADEELPHTGTGLAEAGVGVFGAATVGGVLLYHFLTRRKINL